MARAAGYGYAPIAADGIDAYMERTNEEVLILPQCETKECLEKIEEIAAIPGVDGIFIGPYDLTIALGKPAQFSDPEVKAAFDRILKACRAAGKFAFIFTGSKEAARSYLEQGFDAVTYNSDVITMIEAYQKILGEIKGGE